jgi:hypothetical protein
VTVLVELQARFDEEVNIHWARALEEVGAHVVYGPVGLKTHCTACLVVRQEAGGIRRYCHLGTGNYNARTGDLYGDLGLFTSRDSFGEDLTELFSLLTGGTHPRGFHHLLLAPTDRAPGSARSLRGPRSTRRVGWCRLESDYEFRQFFHERSRAMKTPFGLLGIALIALGLIALVYQGITYTTREKVVDIGPLKITADKEKTLPLSPILGGLALAGGIVLVVAAARKS